MHGMQQTCRQCSVSFEITPDDLAFYDKVSPVFNGKKEQIPPPTLCWDCRLQRKLAWRNERQLTLRTCAHSGERVVSIYSPEHPFPVYGIKAFWSDEWDAVSYGREYDSSRSFFDQYMDLQRETPRAAIMNDDGMGSENCAYCQDMTLSRNCYLVIGTWKCEDSFYSKQVDRSKSMMDCDAVVKECAWVYGSIDSQHLYHCAFLQDSSHCNGCFFGNDLRGCSDCCCCFGLRNKQYHFFNQSLSEAEYRQKVAEYRLDTYSGQVRAFQEFHQWMLQFPRRHLNLQNCEDCIGNNLFNCKEVTGYQIFDGEHSRYVDTLDGTTASYDIFNSGSPQWCYESYTVDNCYGAQFCMWCINSRQLFYCEGCHQAESLFGCISLRGNRYCILNKQYTKEEYEALVPKIIEKMRADGEWGEFFPVQRSMFPYNLSVAQEYFPFSKGEVLARGWKWRDQTDEMPKVDKIIPAAHLPDSIDDIPDDILNWAIECDVTKRPFKIIKQELEFYRKMRLPVPRLHPDERHRRRMALRNPRKLWKRECMKCGKDIETSYSPERPEIVYCESCYLASVY